MGMNELRELIFQRYKRTATKIKVYLETIDNFQILQIRFKDSDEYQYVWVHHDWVGTLYSQLHIAHKYYDLEKERYSDWVSGGDS